MRVFNALLLKVATVLLLLCTVYTTGEPDLVTRDLCSCEHLEHCLQQDQYGDATSRVAIVSYAAPGTREFAIPDIEQFSVYHNALLMAYAERRGYMFRYFRSTAGMDVGNTTDSRWYKIKILEDA